MSTKTSWMALGLVFLFTQNSPVQASTVFPKFECYSAVDANNVTFWFSVDNQSTTPNTPSINIFEPTRFVPPSSFDPGFTPRVFSITVDPNADPVAYWFLDGDIVVVDTTQPGSDKLCANSQQGPPGVQGPAGAQGPTGPVGAPGASYADELSFCHSVSNTVLFDRLVGKLTTATATCSPDEFALNGGGSCERGRIVASGPVWPNSWQAVCQKALSTTATAVCCPR